MRPIFQRKVSDEDVDKLLKLNRKTVYPQIGWRGTLFLIGASFLMAAVLMPSFTLPRKTFVEGELSPSDIKAQRSFDIVDQKSTQKLQDSAESNVRSVYDADPKLYS